MDLEEQVLEGATWKACATNEGFNGESTLGNIGGVFEQSDVACHQGRCEEAEDLPEGEVPRHDGQDDADRIPANVAFVVAGGDGLRGEDAGGVLGEVAAGVGAFE